MPPKKVAKRTSPVRRTEEASRKEEDIAGEKIEMVPTGKPTEERRTHHERRPSSEKESTFAPVLLPKNVISIVATFLPATRSAQLPLMCVCRVWLYGVAHQDEGQVKKDVQWSFKVLQVRMPRAILIRNRHEPFKHIKRSTFPKLECIKLATPYFSDNDWSTLHRNFLASPNQLNIASGRLKRIEITIATSLTDTAMQHICNIEALEELLMQNNILLTGKSIEVHLTKLSKRLRALGMSVNTELAEKLVSVGKQFKKLEEVQLTAFGNQIQKCPASLLKALLLSAPSLIRHVRLKNFRKVSYRKSITATMTKLINLEHLALENCDAGIAPEYFAKYTKLHTLNLVEASEHLTLDEALIAEFSSLKQLRHVRMTSLKTKPMKGEDELDARRRLKMMYSVCPELTGMVTKDHITSRSEKEKEVVHIRVIH